MTLLALMISVPLLLYLWRLCRDRGSLHRHAWETLALGPWTEVDWESGLPLAASRGDGEYAESERGGVCERVALCGDEHGDDAAESQHYKWFRTELVCCHCGVTHERYHVVTDRAMWVTE